MTPEQERQYKDKVNEVAEFIYSQNWPGKLNSCSQKIQGFYKAFAKAILQLPGIRIEDADQSKPGCYDGNRVRIKAFRDMEQSGFIRVLPKEEKC